MSLSSATLTEAPPLRTAGKHEVENRTRHEMKAAASVSRLKGYANEEEKKTRNTGGVTEAPFKKGKTTCEASDRDSERKRHKKNEFSNWSHIHKSRKALWLATVNG